MDTKQVSPALSQPLLRNFGKSLIPAGVFLFSNVGLCSEIVLKDNDFISKVFSVQKADLLGATEPTSSNLRTTTSLLGFQFDPTMSVGGWQPIPGKANLSTLALRQSSTKVSLDGVESESGSLFWSFEKDSSNGITIGNSPQLTWTFPTNKGSCIQARTFNFWPRDEVSVPGFQRSKLDPDEIPRVNTLEFRPTSKRDTYVSAYMSLNGCLSSIRITLNPLDSLR